MAALALCLCPVGNVLDSRQGVQAEQETAGLCHHMLVFVQADDTVHFILLKRARDSIIPAQVQLSTSQDPSSSDAPEFGQTIDGKQHHGPAASAWEGGRSKSQSNTKGGKDHPKLSRFAAVPICPGKPS